MIGLNCKRLGSGSTILKSGLELIGDVRIGSLVRIDEHWSAEIGGVFKQEWWNIGAGIFIGFGYDDSINLNAAIHEPHVCVYMPRGLTWFSQQILRLTLIEGLDDS